MADRSSDEDDCSPEYVMTSEPIKDPYSTDEEEVLDIEEKMLDCVVINSSECYLWEVNYFLDFSYERYYSSKNMLDISSEVLLEEILKFYYVDGLPDYYKLLNGMDKDDSWTDICSSLYEKFLSYTSGNRWLKNNYPLDYSIITDEDILKQSNETFEKSLLGNCLKDSNIERAHNVADSMNHALSYLRDGEVKKVCDKKGHFKTKYIEEKTQENSEKCDRIKGMLCEIMSFVNMRVLHNGESILDFQSHIKDRADAVNFKVRPDITAFINSTGKEMSVDPEPYLVCQVFCPVSDKVQKFPRTSSKQGTHTKRQDKSIDHTEKFVNLQVQEQTAPKDTCPGPRKLSSNEEKKFDKIPAKVTSCNHVSMPRNDEPNPVKSTARSIYGNKRLREKIRDEVTFCAPLFCSEERAANKLYGQFALQLYGAIQARRYVRLNQDFDIPKKDNVFGIFVMNEFVFLAKISNEFVSDRKANFLMNKNKTTITYASNIWFNLNKPSDRMVLMCFLFHLNKIQRCQMHRKYLSRFEELHQGMGYKQYFEQKSLLVDF